MQSFLRSSADLISVSSPRNFHALSHTHSLPQCRAQPSVIDCARIAPGNSLSGCHSRGPIIGACTLKPPSQTREHRQPGLQCQALAGLGTRNPAGGDDSVFLVLAAWLSLATVPLQNFSQFSAAFNSHLTSQYAGRARRAAIRLRHAASCTRQTCRLRESINAPSTAFSVLEGGTDLQISTGWGWSPVDGIVAILSTSAVRIGSGVSDRDCLPPGLPLACTQSAQDGDLPRIALRVWRRSGCAWRRSGTGCSMACGKLILSYHQTKSPSRKPLIPGDGKLCGKSPLFTKS